MVRLTSVLPVFFACAFASPMTPRGSWLGKAAAPAAMPEPLRKLRRSTAREASAEAARASGLRACAVTCDLRVSSMVGSSDLGGLVVLLDVLRDSIARRRTGR